MKFTEIAFWMDKIKDPLMDSFSATEEGYAADGKIPPLSNIKGAPVYITTSQ